MTLNLSWIISAIQTFLGWEQSCHISRTWCTNIIFFLVKVTCHSSWKMRFVKFGRKVCLRVQCKVHSKTAAITGWAKAWITSPSSSQCFHCLGIWGYCCNLSGLDLTHDTDGGQLVDRSDVTIVRSGRVTCSQPSRTIAHTGKILREHPGNNSQAGPGQGLQSGALPLDQLTGYF